MTSHTVQDLYVNFFVLFRKTQYFCGKKAHLNSQENYHIFDILCVTQNRRIWGDYIRLEARKY